MRTVSALERISERVAGVEAEREKTRGRSPTASEPLRLPLWPDAMRDVPNGLLCSALFGSIGKGKRRFLKREPMAAVESLEVSFTGERLDQADLDVWEAVLHAEQQQELGARCRITVHALLKLMGKTDTDKNRDALHASLDRLRAGAVTIKAGRYTYIGGLLAWTATDEGTQEWVIEVDAQMLLLFDDDQ